MLIAEEHLPMSMFVVVFLPFRIATASAPVEEGGQDVGGVREGDEFEVADEAME